jgi:hypothetical protein
VEFGFADMSVQRLHLWKFSGVSCIDALSYSFGVLIETVAGGLGVYQWCLSCCALGRCPAGLSNRLVRSTERGLRVVFLGLSPFW